MAVTPNYSWPVPVATDFVKDGWEAISDLGNAIDTTVAGLGSGLTLVKSQTIGSAVSSVVVTDAFSASYDNYKILISGGVASTGVELFLKLGASATNYNYVQYGVNSLGSSLAIRLTSQTSFFASIGSVNEVSLNIDLMNPYLEKYTLMASQTWVTGNSTGYTTVGHQSLATSYTDFTLTPSSGTITGGEIRVYGYQK
jgi:hypothetical protein